jgi:hypothetical protein
VALQVDRDELPPGERRRLRLEHVEAAQPAVEQQQRLTLAPHLVVVVDAFEGGAAAGLGGRGRLSGRGERGKQGEGNQRWLEHGRSPLTRRRSARGQVDSPAEIISPLRLALTGDPPGTRLKDEV